MCMYYTWINVYLNFAEWKDFLFPNNTFFFLQKKNPFISPIPFSFYPPFTDKPVFEEKAKNFIFKVTKLCKLTKKTVKTEKMH